MKFFILVFYLGNLEFVYLFDKTEYVQIIFNFMLGNHSTNYYSKIVYHDLPIYVFHF